MAVIILRDRHPGEGRDPCNVAMDIVWISVLAGMPEIKKIKKQKFLTNEIDKTTNVEFFQ